jgi:pyruvate kinase
LNFSHGTHDQHKSVVDHINKINENYPFHIAILADLQGPKLRVGEIANNELHLNQGDHFYFTNVNVWAPWKTYTSLTHLSPTM